MIPFPVTAWASIAAKVALVAAVVGAGAWFTSYQRDVGRGEIQAKWDKQKTEDLTTLNALKDKLREVEGKLQATVSEAQNAKEKERKRTAAAAARVAAADERLRDSVDQYATGLAIAQDSLEACRQRASTLGRLHSEALRSHRQCQVDAESLASDVRLLLRSWPVIDSTP